MTKETVIEVVQALTGSCYPYGSTEIDNDRLNNLNLKIELFNFLLDEIEEASRLKNRPEWSIREIASKAYEHLEDVYDYLKEIVGESNVESIEEVDEE